MPSGHSATLRDSAVCLVIKGWTVERVASTNVPSLAREDAPWAVGGRTATTRLVCQRQTWHCTVSCRAADFNATNEPLAGLYLLFNAAVDVLGYFLPFGTISGKLQGLRVSTRIHAQELICLFSGYISSTEQF